jgi:hypothetical protein
MKWHRIGWSLAAALGLVTGGSFGCGPAETGDAVQITGTAPSSDFPQTQEEYMKRQVELQKGAYQEAGTTKKK